MVDGRECGDPGRSLPRPGSTRRTIAAIGLTGQMHGLVLLDAADGSSGPPSSGTTSGRARSATLIRQAVGPERLIRITGNDALTGFTAPKLVWVRDHEPDAWARAAHVLLPEGLRPAAADRRARHGQGRRRGHAAVRPGGARLVGRGARGAGDPASLAAADLRGSRGHRASSRAEAAAATGLRAGTPVVAGGGDQAANAVGVGAVVPGRMALSLGTSGVVFATTDAPALRAGGPCPRVLPRGAGALAHDVGDALRRRQPPMVP